MSASLLDTDTLSHITKAKNPLVLSKASQYLTQHGIFTFSFITRYEILRGLKAKQATTQLAAFESRCQNSVLLPISDNVIVRAADIYADLKRQGLLIMDADILIAATALVHGLVLVTSNTNHFQRIQGLQLDNWTVP